MKRVEGEVPRNWLKPDKEEEDNAMDVEPLDIWNDPEETRNEERQRPTRARRPPAKLRDYVYYSRRKTSTDAGWERKEDVANKGIEQGGGTRPTKDWGLR